MSSAPSPYTTLGERVSCEREIKKSKFIAVAAPISDEPPAHSFLSQNRILCEIEEQILAMVVKNYKSLDESAASGMSEVFRAATGSPAPPPVPAIAATKRSRKHSLETESIYIGQQ